MRAEAAIREGRKSKKIIILVAIFRSCFALKSTIGSACRSPRRRNLSMKDKGLGALKSKLRVVSICLSSYMTDSFSMPCCSSSVSSLIILLIEGVIGCSSFAAIIVEVATNKGSSSLFID